MCRWFLYVSPEEPCLLTDVLINPKNAITKQVSEHYLPHLLPHGGEKDLRDADDKLIRLRNSLLNMDGLGVAWYTDVASAYNKDTKGTRPALYKTQSPPINDFNFRSLCNNTESYCLIAHIRASSGAVVSPANCHPFVFGRHVFAHNGVVDQFSRIRRQMLDLMAYDAYENIKGTTDSEHLAALYMTNLAGFNATKDKWEHQYSLQAMKEALTKTVITVLKLQHTILGDAARANSLNLCATDGYQVVTCRFRNHATQQPPSLYWSEFAGRKLNRKYPGHPDSQIEDDESTSDNATTMNRIIDDGKKHGKHTIVASEPTTFKEDEWHLIGKNCMLLVDAEGTETEVSLDYDPILNKEGV